MRQDERGFFLCSESEPCPSGQACIDGYCSGQLACLAEGNALRLVDVAEPSSPAETGFLDFGLGVDVRHVETEGRYAYLSGSSIPLTVLDIADPETPIKVGEAEVTSEVDEMVLVGDHVYLADMNQGLIIIDVSDPRAPVTAATLDLPHTPVAVTATPDTVYVGYSSTSPVDNMISVVDVSETDNPREIGQLDIDEEQEQWSTLGTLGLSGSHLLVLSDPLVSGSQPGICRLDLYKILDDPQELTKIGTLELPGGSARITVRDQYAFIAADDAGLRVVDLSEPDSPRTRGYYDSLGHAVDVDVVGNYAYVADSSGGLRIVDISDVEHLSEVGALEPFADWWKATGVSVVLTSSPH